MFAEEGEGEGGGRRRRGRKRRRSRSRRRLSGAPGGAAGSSPCCSTALPAAPPSAPQNQVNLLETRPVSRAQQISILSSSILLYSQRYQAFLKVIIVAYRACVNAMSKMLHIHLACCVCATFVPLYEIWGLPKRLL